MATKQTDCMGGDADNTLISGRIEEKAELQNLNQRFSNYINVVRRQREKQFNKVTNTVDEQKWRNEIENLRLRYEQQLSEMRTQLEILQCEKNELEATRSKYDSMSSEFEGRFLSLNETVLKQTDQITKLQVALTNKELEVQQAQAQLTAPRTELESCKLERDDLKKRLAEAERRFQTGQKEIFDVQHQLNDYHTRCSHEMVISQQEISDLHNRLENSRQLILELEETSPKSGQQNGHVSEMMRKARESSEIELRRYMEEAEAKHQLNISEIRLQMEADANNLTSLMEANGKLQADLNNAMTEQNLLQSKLSSTESAYKVTQTSLDSERKSFESQRRKLDRKLQETQDLLLIKVRELDCARDANIPLQTEINMLKTLIEEEEKRLGLEGTNYLALKNAVTTCGETGSSFQTKLLNGHLEKTEKDVTFQTSSASQQMDFKTGSRLNMSSMYESALPRRPSSVPIATRGFTRGPQGTEGAEVFRAPLAGSKFNDEDGKEREDISRNESAASSLIYFEEELDEGGRDLSRRSDERSPGLSRLPPRPSNPTPPRMLPRRPASAVGSRYVHLDAGQGRDYFDAMFNDLRKDTMYTKVTENRVGTDTARVTSSLHQDLINSTSSHAIRPSKNGLLWYSGSTASATGNMKLVEIDEIGRFVRVHNASPTRTEDIGGCLLQQNVAGHPVAVFRFPPRTKLQPGHTATVWSATCNEGIHDPPTHYIWKQLDKWGTGPECTTILCKANGQAVAWMTSAPRISRVSRSYEQHQPDVKNQTREVERLANGLQNRPNHPTSDDADYNGIDADYGRVSLPYPSSYSAGPTLYSETAYAPSPNPVIKREKSSRILPTRTGSAPLRKYVAPPSQQQVSSEKKSSADPCGQPSPKVAPFSAPAFSRSSKDLKEKFSAGVTSTPHLSAWRGSSATSPKGSVKLSLPGTFLSPGDQHRLGMQRLQSHHNLEFLPPMPRAFPPVNPIYTLKGEKSNVVLSH
ncbi:uncharacterized protein LOC143450030 isoform X3 [Clavelina lepadiformis]|uniref:uncharacterized protein LOC143450030 isoform X3 n=1 Tax=Clavelina lepadiformis TaxID=159417 RepID=UPI004042E302